MKYFVTGGAGFIGSNLVDHLLKKGHQVILYDNFSTGQWEFIMSDDNLEIIDADLNDVETLNEVFQKNDIEMVFHLAANADVRFGLESNNRQKDIYQNIVATSNVLECMVKKGMRKIVFSSTGSIYGETTQIPTPEDARMPIQTSLYGTSKLSAEGLISSYVEGFGMQAWIFRFVSILGPRYSHGHVFDFYQQLKEHPEHLSVLGDGTQRKSYLHVNDCIDAIMMAIDYEFAEKINIYNLGTDEYISVAESVQTITDYLELNPILNYSGGNKGWIGDNPFIYLDTSKIREIGWKPKYSIKEAVESTVEYLRKNEWLIEKR